MELLPCPFCNSVDAPSVHGLEIGHRGGYSFGWCDTNYGGCGAQSGAQSTKGAAIAAWNRRAPADPALLASVAEWRQLAETQDAIIQRGATLPDPALLALAKFGAMVLDWSPLECGFPTIPGGIIDEMAVRSGCALEDSDYGGHECWTAPDVKLAIAALLAPDGAASEGVTDV